MHADDAQAHTQADTDKALYELEVISGLAYSFERQGGMSHSLRNDLVKKRSGSPLISGLIASQTAVQEAKVDQMRTLAQTQQSNWMC